MSTVFYSLLRPCGSANCFPAAPRYFSHSRYLLALPKDPVSRKLAYDKERERKRLRYANDPVYREQLKAKNREQYQKKSDDAKKKYNQRNIFVEQQRRMKNPLFKLSHNLEEWVRGLLVKPVQWTTHEPIMHPEKVGLRCEDCTRESFRKTSLWWHDIQDPGKQLCWAFFTKRWPEGLPLDYEIITDKNGKERLIKKKTTNP